MAEAPLDFSSIVSSAQKQEVLKPVVYRTLHDPKFKGFDVPVKAWTAREYDGKFHPSSHSTWTVRQLYIYLTRPKSMLEERMELTSILAVTAGSFWHEFLQNLWLAEGKTLVRQRTDEQAARTGINPAEVKVTDPEINVIGHADGQLVNGDGLEVKTINDFQIHKIDSEHILKEKKFSYWCQTQDYLAVLGLKIMRYFLLAPSYPYPMGEFTVRADLAYQAKRRAEYQQAMRMAAEVPDGSLADRTDTLPVCCSPGSKTAANCPARLGCVIGRYTK